MNYSRISASFFAVLLAAAISAQGITETRSFMKSVPADMSSRLELTNKYGSIHITAWDKDSVNVRVELKGYAPSREKLRKMFDGITVNFTEARELLSVKTEFTQSIGMLFENFKGMTGKFITYESKVEINYYVNVPSYINLTVDSRYGDVFMEDIGGQSSVAVSNGSLKAGTLGKGTSLSLTFCDASVSRIESGNVKSSFSELSVRDAGDLSVSSVSSRFEIGEAGKIYTESRRDKFFIDELASFEGDSYFSEIRIGVLREKIDFTTKYGNLDARNIERGFRNVTINSSFTDLILEFSENSSYEFEIRELNSSVGLPSEKTKSEMKTISSEKKEYMTFGTYGSNPGSSRVKIDATRSKVYIR